MTTRTFSISIPTVSVDEDTIKKALNHKSIVEWAYILQNNGEEPPHYSIVGKCSYAIETDVIGHWFKQPGDKVGTPKGRGAFLNSVSELLDDGKKKYNDSEVKSNFNWREQLDARKPKTTKPKAATKKPTPKAATPTGASVGAAAANASTKTEPSEAQAPAPAKPASPTQDAQQIQSSLEDVPKKSVDTSEKTTDSSNSEESKVSAAAVGAAAAASATAVHANREKPIRPSQRDYSKASTVSKPEKSKSAFRSKPETQKQAKQRPVQQKPVKSKPTKQAATASVKPKKTTSASNKKHRIWPWIILGLIILALIIAGIVLGVNRSKNKAQTTTAPVVTTVPADENENAPEQELVPSSPTVEDNNADQAAQSSNGAAASAEASSTANVRSANAQQASGGRSNAQRANTASDRANSQHRSNANGAQRNGATPRQTSQHNSASGNANSTGSYRSANRVYSSVPSLKRDAALESAARVRAKELAENFSHNRPNGSSFRTAYPGYATREIISRGYLPSISTAGANSVGAACYVVDGTEYWVVVVGNK